MHRRISLLLLTVVLATGMFVPVNGHSFTIFSRYTSVTDVNGEVSIGISDVSDGKAHYYLYKAGDKTIKFFIVKSPDGVLRAAFDACDVCFPAQKGYDQEGDFMLCKNCGRKFHSSRVNVVEGGCNPAPLERLEIDEKLVIKVADILPGGRFF